MSNDALTTQLLEWVGNKPRNYSETMEAWRTSCPRLTIFEDALSEGLLERVPGLHEECSGAGDGGGQGSPKWAPARTLAIGLL
jgi:hypothetical protein